MDLKCLADYLKNWAASVYLVYDDKFSDGFLPLEELQSMKKHWLEREGQMVKRLKISEELEGMRQGVGRQFLE